MPYESKGCPKGQGSLYNPGQYQAACRKNRNRPKGRYRFRNVSTLNELYMNLIISLKKLFLFIVYNKAKSVPCKEFLISCIIKN